MVRLSDRLLAIAGYVPKGSVTADIGTDHGSLPLYLVEQGICPRVIMTDISEASLSKAVLAGGSYLSEGRLSARAGDGLAPLTAGEAETVIMAGLGGNLMIDILSKDPGKARSMKYYLLQPRKAVGRLRQYLASEGYRIGAEIIVAEGRHLCEILWAASPMVPEEEFAKAVKEGTGKPLLPPLKDMPKERDAISWEVPPYLDQVSGGLTEEYLAGKIAREKRNLAQRERAKEPDPEKLAESRDNLAYLAALHRKETP